MLKGDWWASALSLVARIGRWLSGYRTFVKGRVRENEGEETYTKYAERLRSRKQQPKHQVKVWMYYWWWRVKSTIVLEKSTQSIYHRQKVHLLARVGTGGLLSDGKIYDTIVWEDATMKRDCSTSKNTSKGAEERRHGIWDIRCFRNLRWFGFAQSTQLSKFGLVGKRCFWCFSRKLNTYQDAAACRAQALDRNS